MSTRGSKGVAVVVGVGAGLGAALARRFAGDYAVALMARDEGKLLEFASKISAAGGQAIAVSVDVSKAEEIQSAFARTRRELGEVDVLLYNAAMRPFGRLMETKPSTFETTWRVNAFGAFLCSREVVPAMLNTKRGAIIFTGATAGIRPFPTSAAFGPSNGRIRTEAPGLKSWISDRSEKSSRVVVGEARLTIDDAPGGCRDEWNDRRQA